MRRRNKINRQISPTFVNEGWDLINEKLKILITKVLAHWYSHIVNLREV